MDILSIQNLTQRDEIVYYSAKGDARGEALGPIPGILTGTLFLTADRKGGEEPK